MRVGGAMRRAVGRRWMSSTADPAIPPITATPPRLLPLPMPDEEAAFHQQRLGYTFNNRALLEDALTHTSYPLRLRNKSSLPMSASLRSYKPLIPIGEDWYRRSLRSVFGLTGKLSDLNTSCHHLARIAIRAQLYHFLRRYSPKLDREVEYFINAQNETRRGMPRKVPKVLPNLALALAGAVYLDGKGKHSMLEELGQHFLPFGNGRTATESYTRTTLESICLGYRMSFDLKKEREVDICTTRVFINNILYGSHSSSREAEAEGIAILEALNKLPMYMLTDTYFDKTKKTVGYDDI